jgi:peroxiredoxin
MLSRKLPITIALFLSLAFSAYSQSALRIGSIAPQFSGTSADGTPYDLAQLRGKVVVLTFWSTRCEVCRVELPQLDRVVEQYDPKDVLFLALTTEGDEKISAYLRSHPFRFTTITNSFGTLLQYADRDRDGRVNMPYPSFFIVDPRGRMKYRASGYDKTAALDSAIRQLIAAR